MDSGVATESIAAAQAASTLDVERPLPTISLLSELRGIAEASGKSWAGLIRDFAKLAFGPGKLSFDEYLGMRLYDERWLAGADKREFVGVMATRRIWFDANYQVEHFGLLENKLAANALFGAYGFPVIPTLGFFCNRAGLSGGNLLQTEGDLRGFLTRAEHYPLFGKPANGLQSLGSASFERYDPSRGSLVGSRGSETPLDGFVHDVATHFGAGYLFQPRVSPHGDVRALCGDRLATVRLLTILTKDGPKLLRACWKLPAGANVADNFWRTGNMLAQLDPGSGRVLRVLRGSGRSSEALTQHPDTGAEMIGFAVPNWRRIVDLALEGTKVLPEVALIGWDIAPVEGGALLVELNQNPDFKLVQISDARGIMDATMAAFLAERRAAGKAWRREIERKAKEPEALLKA